MDAAAAHAGGGPAAGRARDAPEVTRAVVCQQWVSSLRPGAASARLPPKGDPRGPQPETWPLPTWPHARLSAELIEQAARPLIIGIGSKPPSAPAVPCRLAGRGREGPACVRVSECSSLTHSYELARWPAGHAVRKL